MEPTETKATANQKVFITLDAYTRVVNEYARVCREVSKGRPGNPALETALDARKQALEFVIEVTGLPVPVRD
jgi:hypothetical protein